MTATAAPEHDPEKGLIVFGTKCSGRSIIGPLRLVNKAAAGLRFRCDGLPQR